MSKTLATWFSPSLKVMSRANGTSVVAAAAYRACIDLVDERTGLLHTYANKRGHIHTEYIGPYNNANDLWNAAEKSETRKNSRCARELLIPLPHDFEEVERIELARSIGLHLREKYGVAVQVSIHDQSSDENKNHHAHIMFTTRVVDDAGNFLEKTRSLDEGRSNTKKKEKGEVELLRERVCEIVNTHAEKLNKEWYVYAKKFKDIDETHDAGVHVVNYHALKKAQSKLNKEIEDVNIAFVEAYNKEEAEQQDDVAARYIDEVEKNVTSQKKNNTRVQTEEEKHASYMLQLQKLNEQADAERKADEETIKKVQDELNKKRDALLRSFEIEKSFQEYLRLRDEKNKEKDKKEVYEKYLQDLEHTKPNRVFLTFANTLGIETSYQRTKKEHEQKRDEHAKNERLLKAAMREHIKDYNEYCSDKEHKERARKYLEMTPDFIAEKTRLTERELAKKREMGQTSSVSVEELLRSTTHEHNNTETFDIK